MLTFCTAEQTCRNINKQKMSTEVESPKIQKQDNPQKMIEQLKLLIAVT
jgi:hypothetical protein